MSVADRREAMSTKTTYVQPKPRTGIFLALLQVLVETALYLGLATAVGRASTWFGRPKVRRRLEAASGTVLIGLGLRVATTSR